MRRVDGKLDGGFHGLEKRTRRAENLQNYPLTGGMISYKTVRNVGLVLGFLTVLSLPGEDHHVSGVPSIPVTNLQKKVQEDMNVTMLTSDVSVSEKQ